MVSPDSLASASLSRAIEKVGSQTAMGKLLGVSQNAVSRWARGLSQLPPEHVIAVETATGVSRHDLRPDIYPRETLDRTSADRGVMEPAR